MKLSAIISYTLLIQIAIGCGSANQEKGVAIQTTQTDSLVQIINWPIGEGHFLPDELTQTDSMHYLNEKQILALFEGRDTVHFISPFIRVFRGHIFETDLRHTYLGYEHHPRPNDDMESVQCVITESGSDGGMEIWRNKGYPFLSGLRDTIADLNGDGNPDIYNWQYSPAGCCRRDALTIWTYDNTSHNFRDGFELLNALFFPANRRLLSQSYGHAPDIFVMEWTGITPDTLEGYYQEEDATSYWIDFKTGKSRNIRFEDAPESILEALDYHYYDFPEWGRPAPISTKPLHWINPLLVSR